MTTGDDANDAPPTGPETDTNAPKEAATELPGGMTERRFRTHMQMVALVSTTKHLREHHGYTTVPDNKRDLHIAHAAEHGRDWSEYRQVSQ